jgi:hypothetical protein
VTLTVTPTVEAFVTPVRVRLNVVSTLGGNDRVTVTRVHDDGARWVVLTEQGARLASGSWVGYDYHFPALQTITYEATAGVESAVSTTVMVSLSSVWLHHPSDPALSVQAMFVPENGMGDDEVTSKAGVWDIVGSEFAVSVSDETLRTASSVSLAVEASQVPAVKALLRKGGPLLLVVPGWDVSWRWIQPQGGVSIKVPGGRKAVPFRIVTIPYVVVDQPDVDLQSPWNYTLLGDAFASYTAMNAAYSSNENISTDTRVP